MKIKKYTKLAVILILLGILASGIYIHVRSPQPYLISNTASFFYNRARLLNQDGYFPKTDEWNFAPEVWVQNYPFLTEYVAVYFYKLASVFSNTDFFDFMMRFPFFMYILIIIVGFVLLRDIYDDRVALLFGLFFTISYAGLWVTRIGYFTEESLGVFLIITTVYFLIKASSRHIIYKIFAVISLTLLYLTWQPPIIYFSIGILVILLTSLRNPSKVFWYLIFIFLPLILGHFISRYLIGIHYSPIDIFKETYISITQGSQEYFKIAFSRSRLSPVDLAGFIKRFCYYPGLLFLSIGSVFTLNRFKDIKYKIPFIFLILSMISLLRHLKFEYFALPFIVIVASIGASEVFSISISEKLRNRFKSTLLFLMDKISTIDKKVIFNILISIFMIMVFLIGYFTYDIYKFGLVSLKKNNILYDSVHSVRHGIDRENKKYVNLYHSVSGFARFRQELEKKGFNIDNLEYGRITKEKLRENDILVIGTQTYHGRKLSLKEIDLIVDFVKNGGSLLGITEHDNTSEAAVRFNRLFRHFDIRANFDLIKAPSTSTTTGSWIGIDVFTNHPINEDLSKLVIRSGCSLKTIYGIAFSNYKSWSKYKNKTNKEKSTITDSEKGPFPIIAARTFGKGKVLALSDHNLFSNSWLYYADNMKFLDNAFNWLGKKRINPSAIALICFIFLLIFITLFIEKAIKPLLKYSISFKFCLLLVLLFILGVFMPFIYDRSHESCNILLDIGHKPTIKFTNKYNDEGYYSFYANMTKLDKLKPYAKYVIGLNYKALFLVSPRERFIDSELDTIDRYLDYGKPVILMVDKASLLKDGGVRQLLDKYNIKVSVRKNKKPNAWFNFQGEPEIIKNVFWAKLNYLYDIKGTKPLVTLKNNKIRSNTVSYKRAGNSKIAIVTNLELFNNKALGIADKQPGLFQEQLSYLEFNLLNYLFRIIR